MIVSASRRTDIPAFYAPWFMNRIRAGYCTVPNPFNNRQVSTISLRPEDVDVIVFWTRNPRPLFGKLAELDARGFRYYFQFTLLDNPREVDPKSPPVAAAVATFRELAARIGPDRVIWRYDPIVLGNATGPDFHLERYARIAGQLRGSTHRSVISVMDMYRKIVQRVDALALQGITIARQEVDQTPGFARLMTGLERLASENGMEIQSCAEELDLTRYGIRPGKCIDDEFIARVFGLQLGLGKDPSQRAACGCVASRDIGMYDSCLFGCAYCYATGSFARAGENYARHDPAGESLLPPAAR